MSKDAYYFSHDANARHDEKILELRAELGWEGYGIFWAIIECLREASGYKYSRNRLNGLALQLNTTKEKLELVIFNFDLFDFDDEFIWSESLVRRMDVRDEKTRKAKESAQKRWDDHYARLGQNKSTPVEEGMKSDGTEKAEEPLSDPYAFTEETHSESYAIKEKEIKGKEIKENINSSPPKPEVSQEGKVYANYFKELLPPTQKITDSDLKNWGDTFDKLMRIDRRPREEIYQITEWARKDAFWGEQGNFLSACKLRSKSKDGVLYYDIFLQKFKRERIRTNGSANPAQYQRPAWLTAKG
jgi:hypothetical protein